MKEASTPVLDALGFKKNDSLILDKYGNPFTRENYKVEYDMLKVIPEKVALLKEYGIKPSYLHWYMLLGFDPSYTLEDDLERFNMLNDLGCNVFAMVFRDLTGKVYVDSQGRPQQSYIRPLRDWINGYAFRNVKDFTEFDRYQKALEKEKQLTLF